MAAAKVAKAKAQSRGLSMTNCFFPCSSFPSLMGLSEASASASGSRSQRLTYPPVWMVLSRRAGIGGKLGLLKGWSLDSSSPFLGSGEGVGKAAVEVSNVCELCWIGIAGDWLDGECSCKLGARSPVGTAGGCPESVPLASDESPTQDVNRCCQEGCVPSTVQLCACNEEECSGTWVPLAQG